jgi:hypothetical protein
MFRKFMAISLIVLYTFSFMGSVAADSPDNMTMLGKTAALEKYFYGTEQSGALVDRVNRLNKDLYGTGVQGGIADALDTMYQYVNTSAVGAPSFRLKLNAVEWSLTHAVTSQPATNRIQNMDQLLTGNSTSSSLDSQLNQLVSSSFSSGAVSVSNAVLNKDTLVKIELVSPLSSSTNHAGDQVVYKAAEDVYVNGILVIAKGARGTGTIQKVEPARNFGRDAQLIINFDNIRALDGTRIPTVLGDKAKKENKSLVTAAGASLAGMAILGPVGIIGGAFVHGKDVNIPAGTQLYIQVKDDTSVFGMQS